MEEVRELLILLAIAVVDNVLGGVYVSLSMDNFKFDMRRLIKGLVKAACVCAMLYGLSYIVYKMPALKDTIGLEPKALIVSGIGVYSVKVVGQLTKILGLKKENAASAEKEEENGEYKDI